MVQLNLYDKYIVYYPNLKIEFEDHANNVEGYTFNAYNTLDALITGYPRKIRENEISTKFSFDACFKEGGEYYLAPISRAETNKYRYIFCGWNTVGLQTFSEDDYELSTPEENLAAAKAAAFSSLSLLPCGKKHCKAFCFFDHKYFLLFIFVCLLFVSGLFGCLFGLISEKDNRKTGDINRKTVFEAVHADFL